MDKPLTRAQIAELHNNRRMPPTQLRFGAICRPAGHPDSKARCVVIGRPNGIHCDQQAHGYDYEPDAEWMVHWVGSPGEEIVTGTELEIVGLPANPEIVRCATALADAVGRLDTPDGGKFGHSDVVPGNVLNIIDDVRRCCMGETPWMDWKPE